MKKNENNTIDHVGTVAPDRPRDAQGRVPYKEPQLETLASLSNTLQSGGRVMAPQEETLEAAGVIGNQNILQLIEQGETQREDLAQARTNAEAYNLAYALNAPMIQQ